MDNKDLNEFEEYKEELDIFISQAKEKRITINELEKKEDKLTLDEDDDTIKMDDIIITHFDKKEEPVKMSISKPKNKNDIQKKYLIATLLSSLFIPGLFVLFTIGRHSNRLINAFLFFIVIFLLVACIMVFGYSLYNYFKNKDGKKLLKVPVKAALSIFYTIYIVGCLVLLILLYGPFHNFKDWLVTTAMSTMNHQYYCKWFYSDAEIKEVESRNYVKEPEGSTDPSLIDNTTKDKDKDEKPKKVEYNEYEKKIMIHDENEKYKVVTFEVNGAKAYLAAIYNPADVRVNVTKDLGWRGEYVTSMASRVAGSYVAINGGGFAEDGVSLGGKPTGITIVNHEIKTNNEYQTAVSTGGIIGMTDDNVLVLLKNTTAEEAVKMGVRDAVSWGPFLIVNGEAAHVEGNGGWGGGARTAIGQRKDGTILFLVVDSNEWRTNGAGMEDLVKIMQNYGAVNAANLDGGTSSVLVVPTDIAKGMFNAPCTDYFTQNFCEINDPIDADHIHQTRYVATAWVAANSNQN